MPADGPIADPAATSPLGPPVRGASLAAFLRRHEELLLYSLAALVYIALGVAFKQALAWMIEAAIFLWLTVWLLPAGVRRARRWRR